MKKLNIAIEALKSIASIHRPRHSETKYWIKICHQQCAEVLATDTKIARKALEEILEKEKAE